MPDPVSADAYDPANDPAFVAMMGQDVWPVEADAEEPSPAPRRGERQAQQQQEEVEEGEEWEEVEADEDGLETEWEDEAEEEEEPTPPPRRDQRQAPPAGPPPYSLAEHIRSILVAGAPGQGQAVSPAPQAPPAYPPQPAPYGAPTYPPQGQPGSLPPGVSFDLLHDAAYQGVQQQVANRYAPYFQQAQTDQNQLAAQAIATAYQQEAEKVALQRAYAGLANARSQDQRNYAILYQVAELAARVAYAIDLARSNGLSLEDIDGLMVDPASRRPVTTQAEMERLAAALAEARKPKRRRPSDALPAAGAGTPGASRARDGGLRAMQRINPFSPEFAQMEKALMSGQAIDPATYRPRRRPTGRRSA